MHVETLDGWSLDAERVSQNSWELPFSAWVTNSLGFVVSHGRGRTEVRAASAALLDLRINCSEAAEAVDSLLASHRSELLNPPGRRAPQVDGVGPRPSRRRTDRPGAAQI
jgi:hypothetical protein